MAPGKQLGGHARPFEHHRIFFVQVALEPERDRERLTATEATKEGR
jgi:hypothetical protein